MNILLWILQGLLAAMFLMAGMMKLSQPKDKLKEKIGDWVESYSDGQIKTIGLLEFLGAIGIILPMLINVLPILTPISAIGLGLTMIGAMSLHFKRQEVSKAITNLVLLLFSLFVAYGRFMILPVA